MGLSKTSLILIAGLLLASILSCDRKTPKLRIGDTLPPLAFTDLSGRTVNLPSDLTGRLTVLLFWGEGCPYCERGMPEFEALYTKLRGGGFDFIAIQVGGNRRAGDELARKFSLTFPILHDPESRTIGRYGIAGVPTTFFVNSAGVVSEKILGGLSPENLEEMAVERLK